MADPTSFNTSPRGSTSDKQIVVSHSQHLNDLDFSRMMPVPKLPYHDALESQSIIIRPKKLSKYGDEICEDALSAGSSFPWMEQRRPVQLSSKRPFPSSPPSQKLTEPRGSGMKHISRTSFSPEAKVIHMPQFLQSFQAIPLDLPELGLSNLASCKHSHAKTSHKDQFDSSSNNLTSSPSLLGFQPFSDQMVGAGLQTKDTQPSDIQQTAPFRPCPDSRPIDDTIRNLSHSDDVRRISPPSYPFNSNVSAERPPNVSSSPKTALLPTEESHSMRERNSPVTDTFLLDDHARKAISKLSRRHRVSKNRRYRSPTSACGDLEGPTHRSPMRRYQHSREDPINHPIACRTPNERERQSRRRTNSRASNISKKRATGHKQVSRRDTDRKRIAMHQVAQYWNECIQITEEENTQANLEIGRLHEDICQRERELQQSRAILDDKSNKLRETEASYNELKEEDARIVAQNQALSDEIGSLRDKLSETKKRDENLTEKYREYRSKLNEAIKEQQSLFLQSRAFYHDTMHQLQKENAAKTIDTEAIHAALEKSHEKRNEMKKCVEDFRAETEKQIQNKSQTISQLREEVSNHERMLAQEKMLVDKLRTQLEESQSTHQTTHDLGAKLDFLISDISEKENECKRKYEENSRTVNEINSKLNLIIDDSKITASRMISSEELESKLKDSQDQVVARILPVIQSLKNDSDSAGNAMSQLEKSINQAINDIQCQLEGEAASGRATRELAETQSEGVLNLLTNAVEDTKKTYIACEELQQRMDQLTAAKMASEKIESDHLTDISQQLMDRSTRLTEFEHRLQLLCETFASKVDAANYNNMKEDETTRNMFQLAMAELQNALDEGFRQERDTTMEHVRQNGVAMGQLRTLIDETKEQLEELVKSSCQSPSALIALQNGPGVEQAKGVNIQDKIQTLEVQAAANLQLHQRWLHDIQSIDVIRSQLRTLQQRMPSINGFDTKLDRIVELNSFIQSTASYLSHEKEWVSEQLEGVLRSKGNGHPLAAAQAEAPGSAEGAVAPMISQTQQDKVLSAQIQPYNREATLHRKVIVHSPAPQARSPSEPPSVQQEQRRRREVKQLRSILKSTTCKPVSGIEESLSLLPQVNHRRYNRPVVRLFNNDNINSEALGNEIIAGIRSGLIQQHDWSLPTVADFKKSKHLANNKVQEVHDKQVLPMLESHLRDVKKPRME